MSRLNKLRLIEGKMQAQGSTHDEWPCQWVQGSCLPGYSLGTIPGLGIGIHFLCFPLHVFPTGAVFRCHFKDHQELGMAGHVPLKVCSIWWMDKDVHIYNGILVSHKKEWNLLSFATTWMELDSIMLSERSQRRTNTALSLTCRI